MRRVFMRRRVGAERAPAADGEPRIGFCGVSAQRVRAATRCARDPALATTSTAPRPCPYSHGAKEQLYHPQSAWAGR